MINNDYKNKLITLVNKIGEDTDFWRRVTGKDKKTYSGDGNIGSNNIRSLANICQEGDCYEEIKLYIKYKIAKGNGWEKKLTNGKIFGEAVIEDMEKIYSDYNKNDENALKMISLYFGYLYWKRYSIEKSLERRKRKSESAR